MYNLNSLSNCRWDGSFELSICRSSRKSTEGVNCYNVSAIVRFDFALERWNSVRPSRRERDNGREDLCISNETDISYQIRKHIRIPFQFTAFQYFFYFNILSILVTPSSSSFFFRRSQCRRLSFNGLRLRMLNCFCNQQQSASVNR